MTENTKQLCARCGSCTVVCPVYRVSGRETLSARGKLHLLATGLAEDPSSHFQDIFSQCLLCGACEDSCSRMLPIRDRIVEARSTFSSFYGQHPLQRELVRKALSNPSLLEGLVRAGLNLSRISLLPAESGLRIKLGLLEQEGMTSRESMKKREEKISAGSYISYFSGCMARFLQPSIGEAASRIAETISGSLPHEPATQVCCGLAALSAGKTDEAKKLARRNIEAFAGTPGQILTSCASCSSHLLQYPALFKDDPQWRQKAEEFSCRVEEFTSYAGQALSTKELRAENPSRVYYHDPCHLRFDKDNRGAALKLLDAIANAEMVHTDKGQQCCGQGGLFHLGYPELSGKIFASAYDPVSRADADVVVTSCSGCLMQWQAGLARNRSPVRAVHLALWLRSCM